MRVVILFLALLCLGPSLHAQTLVHTCKNFTSGNVTSCVINGITANNFLMTCGGGSFTGDGGAGSVTVSASGTAQTLTTWRAKQGTTGHGEMLCYYDCAANAGNTTFSTVQTAGGDNLIVAAEYSGIATATCLDQVGGATVASNTPSVTTTGSVTSATELVLGAILDYDNNRSMTAGTGYTLEAINNNTVGLDSQAYEDNNTRTGLSGTQSSAWGAASAADTHQLLIATFKASGVAAANGFNKRQKLEKLGI